MVAGINSPLGRYGVGEGAAALRSRATPNPPLERQALRLKRLGSTKHGLPHWCSAAGERCNVRRTVCPPETASGRQRFTFRLEMS